MTKLTELIKEQVEEIVHSIGFQNDEDYEVAAEVEIFKFDGIEVIQILDTETSRRSQMCRTSTGDWTINRNTKITPNNLKIINKVEKLLKERNNEINK